MLFVGCNVIRVRCEYEKNITKRNKGFTLAELLVVVAIIAILVAVSIPIFTGKLEEARKNTDLANERAARAAAITDYLHSDQEKEYLKYYDAETGTMCDTYSGLKGYNQMKMTGISDMTTKSHVVEVWINSTGEADKSNLRVRTEWFDLEKHASHSGI